MTSGTGASQAPARPARRGGTASRTVQVTAALATTSLVGFVREILLAQRFGTGASADVWGAAFVVFSVAVELLLLDGPIVTWAIPLLAHQRKAHGERGERTAFLALILAVALPAAAVAVGAALGARGIGFLVAPGFVGLRRELITRVMVYVGLAILPAAVAGALGAGMMSRRHFILPALTGLSLHLGIIAALIWLAPSMGVVALGVGLLAGAAGQVVLQLPALRDPGVARPPDWDALASSASLFAPTMVVVLLSQVTLLLSRIFGSTLATGQLAAFYYAAKLEQFPLGLFAVSVSVVAFPEFADLAAEGDSEGLGAAIAKAVRWVLLLAVPSAVGLAVLATPIVRLLFQRGAFGPASTALTAAVLSVYAVGLVGQSVLGPLLRAYFSMRLARQAMVIILWALALNFILDVALLRFGAVGLGIAFAATMSAEGIGLAWGLRGRVPLRAALDLGRLSGVLAAGGAALAAAGLFAYGVLDAALGHMTLATRAAGTFGGILIAALAYGGVVWATRMPEVREATTRLARRLRE